MKPRVLLLVLLIVGLVYLLYLSQESQSVKVGAKAPLFTLPSKSGSVSLESYRGKVVLLNFWATWCPPCAAEMPSLESLKKKMEGRDFEVLAVSLDEGGWEEIDFFLKRNPLSLTILSDKKGDAAGLYGTFQLPETYLIDKEGNIVKKYVGPREWTSQEIVEAVEKYVVSPR